MSSFRNSDGTFASFAPDATIPLALAKDKLRRILTTPCNGRGRIPDGHGGRVHERGPGLGSARDARAPGVGRADAQAVWSLI